MGEKSNDLTPKSNPKGGKEYQDAAAAARAAQAAEEARKKARDARNKAAEGIEAAPPAPKKYKSGGKVRGDGCAVKGKTRGRYV